VFIDGTCDCVKVIILRYPNNHTEVYSVADCCLQRDKVPFVFSVLPNTTFILESVNCTYNNYTQAAATCSAAQHHSTFTVQILYKLYSLQLNCTYINYTQAAAATFSAAQQERKNHSV
jgi:hypothetical protein